MHLRKQVLSAVAGMLLLRSVTAQAQCQWRWDCTSGACRQIPICRSTLDLPPLPPVEVPPVPLPSIQPLPKVQLPPLGTTQCGQRYLGKGMTCGRQTVCQ
jgi:hypothetical protein